MQDSITKEKKWGKKRMEISAIWGAGQTPNGLIKNFHFVLNPPLKWKPWITVLLCFETSNLCTMYGRELEIFKGWLEKGSDVVQ